MMDVALSDQRYKSEGRNEITKQSGSPTNKKKITKGIGSSLSIVEMKFPSVSLGWSGMISGATQISVPSVTRNQFFGTDRVTAHGLRRTIAMVAATRIKIGAHARAVPPTQARRIYEIVHFRGVVEWGTEK